MYRSPLFRTALLGVTLTSVGGCAGAGKQQVKVIETSHDTTGLLVGVEEQIAAANPMSVRPASFRLAGEPTEAAVPQELADTIPPSESLPALSLADVEQLALSNNPSIRGANAALSKAAGLQRQVGVRPNPVLGYFGSQIADEDTDQHGVFVEQEFVRGNKLKLNQNVLGHTVGAQRWEAEAQRQRVLTDVRVRFYAAAAAQRQLEATEEFANVASRGVQVAADRLEAEEGSKVDLLQAKILLSQIDLAGQQTEAAYRGAWKELAALAGLPDAQPIQLAEAFNSSMVVRNWDSVYAELLAQSPELAVANELVCEKRANLDRQKVQATPNVTTQLGAGYDRATESGLINLQVAAPIPVVNRNSGNIAAAYADYTQSVENVNRVEQAIRSRLAQVASEYESAIAAVNKYDQEILPNARESLTLSEEAYVAGELDFLQVLIVRQRYFDSMIAYIQAQGQLAQANAKIEGLLLTGGLEMSQDFTAGDGLRDQSFGGQ
jgi:outer membrane protein, heavy metal efflux system